MIDVSNIPSEPIVTVINPDGSELITTSSVTAFTWVRLEIKKNKLKGYKVRTANGDVFDIQPNGKIYDENYHWPDGLAGDVYDDLLRELI